MAQDVIVKKDGSTILSKVLEVTSSEVKYKKFSNQDGPTYTIKVSELKAINYQNGDKDTFGDTTEGTHVETVTPQTTFNMNPQQQYNDAELLKIYREGKLNAAKLKKRGKTLRTIGYISGGVLLAGGIAFFVGYANNINARQASPIDQYVIPGSITSGLGVVTGVTLVLVGNKMINKSQSIKSEAIYQQTFPIGKQTNLTADVNVLSDNYTKQKTLGLGFHLNF